MDSALIEEKTMLISPDKKEVPAKKPRRKFLNPRSGDLFDTPHHDSEWHTNAQLIIFVILACFMSITVASKIRFTPVVSHSLSVHFHNRFPQAQIEWIGRLYAIVVLCLLPIVCALIDYYMVSYKVCLIVSGLMHVVACITNSTVTHPLFFVLTDSFVCGFGSAVAFAVFLLAIDDIFPKGHRFRVVATTFCQGSTIGSLFVLDLYAWFAKYWGWVWFQILLSAIFAFLAISLILTCPEYGLEMTVKKRIHSLVEPVSTAEDPAHQAPVPTPVTIEKGNKILGLTFEEMNNSPSVFSWLVYRFILSVIHEGLYLLMFKDSHIILIPDIDVLLAQYLPTTLATIVYSCGESIFYILGAVLGGFFLGYLLHISIVFLCIFFLLLVVWQPVRAQLPSVMGALTIPYSLSEHNYLAIGHIVCAGLTGCCIGALSTCIIAASEEATTIPGRRIFPFVKLLEGMAVALCPFLFSILNRVSEQNIWLLTFAVLTAASACLLVYILHKLYTKYLSSYPGSRTSMQVSMRPAKYLRRAIDSS